jgi:hypothetical protein
VDIIVVDSTDRQITIRWTSTSDPDQDTFSYELALDDSVYAYGITNDRQFTFNNLQPKKEYTVQVIAVDNFRNSAISSRKIHTMKSFIEAIYTIKTGDDYLHLDKVLMTSDGGILLAADRTKNIHFDMSHSFLMKLNANYEIMWIKDFDEYYGFIGITELSSHDFIVLTDKKLMKFSGGGSLQWTYLPSDSTMQFSAHSVAEDMNGNILAGGYHVHYAPGEMPVDEGIISKVTSSGNKIWERSLNTFHPSVPYDILALADGHFMVYCTAVINGLSSSSLMELSATGVPMKQYVYPNSMKGGDLPSNIYQTDDGNFLLGGTADVRMGYYSNIPRLMKVTRSGAVLSDITYDLDFVGLLMPFFIDLEIRPDGSYLMLTYDEVPCLSVISANGTLQMAIPFEDYPYSIGIHEDAQGHYVIFANTGHIIVCNPDGYGGPNDK